MKKQYFPFVGIAVMAALFNTMQVAGTLPDWSIYAANALFALCTIVAAVMFSRKQDK
jgi:hypothetical protein